MYLYVAVMPSSAYYAEGPGRHSLYAVRIEQASGERCLIVPYQEFRAGMVRELKPRAVVMSGFGPRFEDLARRDFYAMNDVMHAGEAPILAICGSHQIAGYCFNGDIRKTPLKDLPMKRLAPGDPLPRWAAGSGPGGLQKAGCFTAKGFYEIRRLREDPLFEGLPGRMLLWCSHYCEVKALPPGFERLADSGHCAIEAMKHRDKCLYGVQFHPEQYDDPFLDGKRVLENFAGVVNRFWEQMKKAKGTKAP